MTKCERENQQRMLNALMSAGISYDDCEALRRISMTLHSWYEKECGVDGGLIERDEETGKPFWINSRNYMRMPIPDRERGAEDRLKAIMSKYPTLSYYLQTDPRGAALYILRPQDHVEGSSVQSYYSRGICVY